MKKIVNGEYMEMTEEEYKAWKKEIDENPIPEPPPDPTDKAEAYDILIGVGE